LPDDSSDCPRKLSPQLSKSTMSPVVPTAPQLQPNVHQSLPPPPGYQVTNPIVPQSVPNP
ncbi:Hypothetical predicted protein, partial [Lynx pardinus]